MLRWTHCGGCLRHPAAIRSWSMVRRANRRWTASASAVELCRARLRPNRRSPANYRRPAFNGRGAACHCLDECIRCPFGEAEITIKSSALYTASMSGRAGIDNVRSVSPNLAQSVCSSVRYSGPTIADDDKTKGIRPHLTTACAAARKVGMSFCGSRRPIMPTSLS